MLSQSKNAAAVASTGTSRLASTSAVAAEAAPALIEGPPRVVDRRHPGADQVAAPADVLYRVLWGRGSRDELALSGDLPRLNAFLDSRLVP